MFGSAMPRRLVSWSSREGVVFVLLGVCWCDKLQEYGAEAHHGPRHFTATDTVAQRTKATRSFVVDRYSLTLAQR